MTGHYAEYPENHPGVLKCCILSTILLTEKTKTN
jgi:hypothetical protein